MQGCAFWGSPWWIIQSPPKAHFVGLNRHFKPNIRKIQIAISPDLCIRLTWNLTGSCGCNKDFVGDLVWWYNNSKMADGRHFENRYITLSQWKIIWFWWNFVHSSRFWTGCTSRDQKWKSCIGQTPSSTERISCLYSLFVFIFLHVCIVVKSNQSIHRYICTLSNTRYTALITSFMWNIWLFLCIVSWLVYTFLFACSLFSESVVSLL